jgi:hypothetical protein
MKMRKLLAISLCLAGFCLPVIAQPAGPDAAPAAEPAPAAQTVPSVDGAKVLDSAATQLMGRTAEQQPVQLAKAEFRFDAPPVVMQPAPFTISFLGSDGKVMENYELLSDLVFDLTAIKGDFSLRLGSDEYKSGRYVVVPFRKVRLDKGTVKGTVIFTQVFKNGKVGVSLARSTEANQTLLVTADINVAFGPAVAFTLRAMPGPIR